jgi:predicted acyl esterase
MAPAVLLFNFQAERGKTMNSRFLPTPRLLAGALASLLVFLPLAGAAADKGAGTERRDWVDGPRAPLTSSVRYEVQAQEIFITARDGTQLGARLLLPQGVPGGPRPCVLLSDGYGHNTPTGTAVQAPLNDLAARGYAGVHVSLRGSGNSGGEANLYNEFGNDGYDVIEWMARQPWCDGNVGMVGPSLLGISQMLAAKENPPSLKAMVPYVACGNCYEYLWYPGGMLPGPGRVSRGPAEYGIAAAHRSYDAFWRSRTTIAPDHRRFAAHGIPALMGGGWNDYISPASIRAFEEMAGARNMLLIGPDAHGVMPSTAVLPHSFLEYQAIWMDRYLRGLHRKFDKEPEALIYVQGANQWRFEKHWPIRDARSAKLYLRGKASGSVASLNDGSLLADDPGRSDGSVSISYSPMTGPFLPTLLNGGTGRFKADQRPEEANVLTWTTRALEVPTEVTGWGKLTFWAEVGGTDADFVVQLTDVAPDGTSTQVTAGYLNASHARSRSHPRLPEPGKVRKYELEIWPTSYVFQAGHRIRLDLAGGAKPGAAGYTQGPGQSPYPALITIHQDRKHASHLELPIVGSSWRELAGSKGRDRDDDDDD